MCQPYGRTRGKVGELSQGRTAKNVASLELLSQTVEQAGEAGSINSSLAQLLLRKISHHLERA
jgi:hypothetical protein